MVDASTKHSGFFRSGAVTAPLSILCAFFLTCCASIIHVAEGCTVFVVGKDASKDGSVLVSHSSDGNFRTDPRLVKVPAQDFDEHSLRPVYFSPQKYPRYVGYDRRVPEYYPKDEQKVFVPIGYIPQVPHTFAYLEESFGTVNEHQVAIGEATCSGVFGATPLGSPNGTALFSIDELTHIALERSTTAREAIQIMGSLAEQYGFYGAGHFEGTAESLAVTDTKEAWIFHILPDPTGTSSIWAAQRVPSNGFSVLANMFVIREVDPHDSDNFMMSDSVHRVALDYHWWRESDGLLDFTRIYSDGEYAHKYYSGRRMWGAYHLACPSCNYPAEYKDLLTDPVYPVWTVTDHLISVQDLFRYHRYTYQDTPYDLSAPGNLAAGPFGSPDRWRAGPNEKAMGGGWERSIGLYRTSASYVIQSKERTALGAILWFGPASSLGTIFTPFVVHMDRIPSSFSTGWQGEFSRESAFWASCYVSNIANLKWNYAIKDVRARQDTIEMASLELMETLENSHDTLDVNVTLVEAQLLKNAKKIVKTLWKLSDEIMFKYASGFVNDDQDHGGMGQIVGYPEWWLEAVGYRDGPPPPPTKAKCCNPPKLQYHLRSDIEPATNVLQHAIDLILSTASEVTN